MKTPEYPKVNKPVHSLDARQILEETAALSEAAGVSLPGLEEGMDNVAHAKDIKAEAQVVREDENALATRIASALVEGELDLAKAAAEVTKAQALVSGSVLQRAVGKTEYMAINRAFARFGQGVDEDALLTQLRTIIEATLTEVRKLRPTLTGITGADQATEAGTKQATAWAEYKSELMPRWNAVHDLTDLMRRQHWFKPLPTEFHRDKLGTAGIRYAPATPGFASRFGRPDIRVENRKEAKRRGETILELLDERCDLWLPGGPYTEAEIRKFHRGRPAVEPARKLEAYRGTKAQFV